ncbi:twin-arginine translocase subunit TatB [Altererythrobacter sp. CC-YST694]|uniref:Sec-independent protein translocase protein TatB n=1 Tax=Altererythrobacter sp. CC-YST694 TaxID=2755038 RepID=UPI001D02CA97|nr:Sec-independent protein translocase protein TatB [Altererythrobacter sp. CC-YST694]MCB5426254.1 twin-arginine translocase subunit TatB [Altererythrobacter sp. CC-YST694]
MFDIGAQELLVIVVVAILVIGPKDMPAALRTAGRWIGKVRRVSNHFRAGVETMIREAEMEEMEKKWQEQNRRVMEQHPDATIDAANGGGVEMVPLPSAANPVASEPASTDAAPAASAEARAAQGAAEPAPSAPAPATPADPDKS